MVVVERQSDQIRSDQIRPDKIGSDQIRSDQIRSDQIRSDHIRSDLLLRAWKIVAIVPPDGELDISSKKFTSAKLSP